MNTPDKNYNQTELGRLAYISESFILDENKQIILSQNLINDGWKKGESFQKRNNEEGVSREILRLKKLRYEVKGLLARNDDDLRMLIYRESKL